MEKQADEAIPPTAREAVARYALEFEAGLHQLDSTFQSQFADAANWQTLFAIAEKYSIERFDVIADELLLTSYSPDPLAINPLYEKYLNLLTKKTLAHLSTVLKTARSDLRDDLLSRIALKLSSRKLAWLAEAKRKHLSRHPAPVTSEKLKNLSDAAQPRQEQPMTTKQRLLEDIRKFGPEEKALHGQLFYHAKREKHGSFPANAVLISEATKTRLDNFESLSADEQAEVLRQLPLLNVPASEPKPTTDTDAVHRLSKKAKAKLEMPHEQRCLVEAIDRARATVLKSKGKIPSNKLLSQFKADLEKSAHVNKVPSLIALKKYCRKENVETIIDDYNDYAAKKIQPNGKRYSRVRPGTLAQKFMADAWRLQPGTVKIYTNEGKKDKNRKNSH